MPKKRKPNKPELESQEMSKVQVEDADSEFDLDDEVLEDDDSLFESGGGLKDDADMLLDEPDEDDLVDFDDDDLLSESLSLDAAALADDPVRMYLKEIGQVTLLDTNRETWLSIQMAAEQLLQMLMDTLSRVDELDHEGGLPDPVQVVDLAYQHVKRNWEEVVEASNRPTCARSLMKSCLSPTTGMWRASPTSANTCARRSGDAMNYGRNWRGGCSMCSRGCT
jgi:hypothetical protein